MLNVVQTNREQIFQEVKATEDNILRALQINQLADLNNQAKPTQHNTMEPPAPAANAATTDAVQLKMLQILERLDKKLDGQPAPKTTKRRYTRKDTSKYCWSHGACGHPGCECKNKKPGHKDEATFDNKMGGSTFLCPPCK